MRSGLFCTVILAIGLAGCASTVDTPTPTLDTAPETRIAAVPSDTPTQEPSETPPPAITATDAPTPTWQTCIFTAGADGAPIYEQPLPVYSEPPDPISSVPAGESAPVALRGAVFEGVLWVGIFWEGSIGHVQADAETLAGDYCPSLPDDDTYAGVGPRVAVPEHIDYRIYVDGAVGTVWYFTQKLPSKDGGLSHMLRVTAELLAMSVRWADYEMQCEGDSASLTWGFWKSDTALLECGDSMREKINVSSKHYIVVSIPEGSAVTYTLKVTLTQFSQ